MTIRSQKGLELELSRLKVYSAPSIQMEQYPTPAPIAAEWIWSMALRGEVRGKTFLDAGCGTGILGIGLLLMGARKVFLVDNDQTAMNLCKENYTAVKKKYEVGEAEFLVTEIDNLDIDDFAGKVDTIVQNPPFGTRQKHLDKKFLEKAFALAPLVYSMHKWSTTDFVKAIARDHGFEITNVWRYGFPLKATFKFHKKPVVRVDVGLWRMKKMEDKEGWRRGSSEKKILEESTEIL